MATRSHSNRKSNTHVGSNFVPLREQTIKFVTKYVIMEGYPLNFGEHPHFVRFMTDSLNPNFKKVERKTLMQEANKEFVKLKKELHETFASLTHKVSLVFDVWRNANTIRFLRMTANWIDRDWLMQRRVIGFKWIDSPVNPDDIYETSIEPIREWGIGDKVFSVTFDEVTDFPEVTEGFKGVMRPILDGRVFHSRCVCRILISCIQDAWELMKPIVTKIRNDISVSEQYPEEFEVFREKYGLEPDKLRYDDDKYYWNSTNDMLKISLPYKDALNEFIAEHWAIAEAKKAPDAVFGEGMTLEFFLVSEQEWEIASVFCKILDVFYDAIDDISSTYNPSLSGVLLHLVNIAKMFSEYRENVAFKQKLSVMEETFMKHFGKIPVLYSVAAVMDPRIKLSGCECLLESFYQCTGNVEVNVDEQKREVSNLLHEMYDLYVTQSKSHFPSSGINADIGSNSFAWSVISHKKQKTEDSAFCELTSYLQRPHESFYNGTKVFDILGWWKAREITYPVLATMARDLLATAVSSITPDCAFVLNKEKRILEDTPYYLRETLELYSCLKDWLHAGTRTQGKRKETEDGQFRMVRLKRVDSIYD